MAGSYVRPETIDVSSFLSGRDNILSKCTPPIPSLDSINNPMTNGPASGSASAGISNGTQGQAMYTNMKPAGQNGLAQDISTNSGIKAQSDISYMLLPKYTKELRSVNSVDSVDYNRWVPNLPVEPQNLRFVIEDFANQRGGFNTRNYTRSAWANQNNAPGYDPNICKTTLNPNAMCGKECTDVNGYPGVDPITGQRKSAIYQPPGTPPGEPGYPFIDVTSQQIASVGAAACGPQFFRGDNYNIGSCPTSVPRVFKNSQ
jgi:hypothetical protein